MCVSIPHVGYTVWRYRVTKHMESSYEHEQAAEPLTLESSHNICLQSASIFGEANHFLDSFLLAKYAIKKLHKYSILYEPHSGSRITLILQLICCKGWRVGCHLWLIIKIVCMYVNTFILTSQLFVCCCLATRFYHIFEAYCGLKWFCKIGQLRKEANSKQIYLINWDALDHAAHAPHVTTI